MQWDAMFVRLLDPRTGELLREHLGQIDRLVHHCFILELNIPSYRMEQAKRNRDSATDTGEAS